MKTWIRRFGLLTVLGVVMCGALAGCGGGGGDDDDKPADKKEEKKEETE